MYPSIAQYALIGDCHTAALVSRSASIDWCCLPRFDSDSCFGRILDWKQGGYFEIVPTERARVTRSYLGDSLILATTFTTRSGSARVIDFFSMRRGGRTRPRRELIRIIEGIKGKVEFRVRIAPRLDFGEVKPWIWRLGKRQFAAIGSSGALLIYGTVALEPKREPHDLESRVVVAAGQRRHVVVQFTRPERVHRARAAIDGPRTLQHHFKQTVKWWEQWTSKIRVPPKADRAADRGGASIMRSAIVLKALTFAPTGAIIAAPTTSLPEAIGGERNWDYRYCWLRDSIFIVTVLASIGASGEADYLRRFVERSAAGHADELQVMYGVGGKRRLTEIELSLDGWRHSKPVRIGNAASKQFQGDMYGLLLELAWRWAQESTHPPEDHYWDFLKSLVEAALARWRLPDRGIWEIRSRPRHFVHSKVMCWAAVSRGIALAERFGFDVPLERWLNARDAIRRDIEKRGYDRRQGIFVQSYGSQALDAALLPIPAVDFIPYDDPRMVRTAEAIHDQLGCNGLVLRYLTEDGLRGEEGVFVACTFWLAECFARQGKHAAARRIHARALASANDLGLFAEEYAPATRQLLGNFPQGLTHLAHIGSALALRTSPQRATPRKRRRSKQARPRTA